MNEEKREELYESTRIKKEYVTNVMKYNFEEIWECKYHSEWVINHREKQKEKQLLPPFARAHPGSISEKTILDAVVNEKLFGMVEVDITVSIFKLIYL